MDFMKEEVDTRIHRRRCGIKRPSFTIIMVAVCFCLIIILCAVSFSGLGSSSSMSKKDDKYSISFSTKTPYRFEENLSTKIRKPDGCVASQLNMVFRHGTRYPSAKDIKKIDNMLDVLRTFTENKQFVIQLSHLGIVLENPYPVSREKELATVGDLELYNIGGRFRQRFPELFDRKFKASDFNFESSCKSRCSQSASAFGMGFLEGRGPIGENKYKPIALEMRPCNDDKILRFFDLCKKYEKDVADNDTAMVEVKKFLHGAEVLEVVKKIENKLKLNGRENLTPEDVRAIYLMCAFGVGIFGADVDKGWCSLFDLEDFNVMEYLLDLKSYYKRSSAYNITYQSSCPLLRALLYSMQAKKEMAFNASVGIFRSAHAETIIPLYALMGLLVDKRHLTAGNYKEMKNREFRGSKIAPFAGNLAIVLYNCNNGTNKVQLYSNEKLIKFPCCSSDIDCDFEHFDKCYQKVSLDCNLKAMCNVDGSLQHDEL